MELVKDSKGLGITIAGYVEQSSGKSSGWFNFSGNTKQQNIETGVCSYRLYFMSGEVDDRVNFLITL